MSKPEYPVEAVRALLDNALRASRKRSPRRTPRQAAAERLVQALSVLMSPDIDEADRVAFEDARAAVEKYRQP